MEAEVHQRRTTGFGDGRPSLIFCSAGRIYRNINPFQRPIWMLLGHPLHPHFSAFELTYSLQFISLLLA